MASKKNVALYIGVTRDLVKRVYEHRNGIIEGFTSRYKIQKLVYVEQYETIENAILREKELKHYKMAWKIELIEKENINCNDLYDTLFKILGSNFVSPRMTVLGLF